MTLIPYIKQITQCYEPTHWGTFIQANSSLLTATRYGVGAEVTDPIYKAMQNGQVEVAAGIVEKGGAKPSPDGTIDLTYQVTGTTETRTIRANHIVSGLGREAVAGPIWESLGQQGMMQRHPTGIGVMVDDGGRMIGTNGQPIPGLYAAGVMRGGDTFMRHGVVGANLVNIPGMRHQALETAATVLRDLGISANLSVTAPDPASIMGGGSIMPWSPKRAVGS